MKRGSLKKGISISLLFLLTISFASAGAIEDFFKFIITGEVTGDGSCFDSDGINNFNTAGYVDLEGTITYDKCDSNNPNIAIDYKCSYNFNADTQDDTTPAVVEILSLLKPSITGKVGDTGYSSGNSDTITLGSSSHDCSLDGADTTCVSNGVCGCSSGSVKSCITDPNWITKEENPLSRCDYGTVTCTSGSFGECIGEIAPTAETCNGLDENCNGIVDDGSNLCPAGKICDNGRCTDNPASGCQDLDLDGYDNCNIGTSRDDGKTLDCLDSNNLIYPNNLNLFCDCNSSTREGSSTGITEICDEIDNDCDGLTDEELVCNAVVCTDQDNDGFSIEGGTCGLVDCNDQDSTINPSKQENCDGIDQNCDGEIDKTYGNSLTNFCGESNAGECIIATVSCLNGQWESCEENGFVGPTTEVCGDSKDNDCDSSIDEDCDCSLDSTKECTPNQECKTGTQTCVQGKWSNCQVTGDKENCDAETSCDIGNIDICGTNTGICIIGKKTCSDSGIWGGCVGSIDGVNEECNNNLDDDCDGLTDEIDCAILAEDIINQNQQFLEGGQNNTAVTNNEESTSSSNENIESQEQNKLTENVNFFSLFWAILKRFFSAGKMILGFSISENNMALACGDSDNGINYFSKGSGEGLSQSGRQIWFADSCYKIEQTNKVDKCGGEDCFLKEYYCDKDDVKSETKVKCKYGCANGACVPDSSLSSECVNFDKELWKWVNIC